MSRKWGCLRDLVSQTIKEKKNTIRAGGKRGGLRNINGNAKEKEGWGNRLRDRKKLNKIDRL